MVHSASFGSRRGNWYGAAVLAAAALVAAGCSATTGSSSGGNGSSPSSSSSGGGSPSTSTSASGGTLTYALDEDVAGFNSLAAADNEFVLTEIQDQTLPRVFVV